MAKLLLGPQSVVGPTASWDNIKGKFLLMQQEDIRPILHSIGVPPGLDTMEQKVDDVMSWIQTHSK